LILCGDGDLVPIAHALHRRAFGEAVPFIVCDPCRRNTPASVRSPANLRSGMEALTAAAGGSLCLRYPGLPPDIDEALRRAHEPDCDVRLFACMNTQPRGAAVTGTIPIHVPPLALREQELPRIVDEYARDARAALGAMSMTFTDDDRRWVMTASRSLQDIEKATLRLVALRASENVTQAAKKLGMAPVSLIRWLERRPFSKVTAPLLRSAALVG
jgi:hypothetical protein